MGIVRRDRYRRGTHNSISDVSGQKYKRSDMRLTWDNKLVGKDEFDPKSPQLIIRPRADRPAVTNQTRTQDINTFLLDPAFNPRQGQKIGHTVALDSDDNAFTVSNKVERSSGLVDTVEFNVLDSDDNSFTVFS